MPEADPAGVHGTAAPSISVNAEKAAVRDFFFLKSVQQVLVPGLVVMLLASAEPSSAWLPWGTFPPHLDVINFEEKGG